MSSFIYWNARGVGNRSTTTHLKNICLLHQPDIIAISEVKIRSDRIRSVATLLGYDNFAHGNDLNQDIWLFWKSSISITIVEWTDQHVTVETEGAHQNGLPMVFSFIHASCIEANRQVLWDFLIDRWGLSDRPWILAGDFNAISTWGEQQGRTPHDSSSMNSFNDFISRAALADAGFSGNHYTWSNNQAGTFRIWERLDRVLANGQALAVCPAVHVKHLARVRYSDHCPLWAELRNPQGRVALFHYQKMWETHPDFYEFVRANWPISLHRNPLVNFGMKLKHLRTKLRVWNWQVFGNLNTNIRQVTMDIDILEGNLQVEWSDAVNSELTLLKSQLADLELKQSELLRAKARINFAIDGDRNSKFFHALIKSRRKNNHINLRLEDGTSTDDRDVIGPEAVKFFADIFTGSNPPPNEALLECIPQSITDADNLRLCAMPSVEEIRCSIQNMNADSAPGPDGFTGHFYKFCWGIIKHDFVAAIRHFFMGFQLPNSFSATMLTLIPKTPNATSVSQLRPISLCNFCHKVISYILLQRLNPLLSGLISEEQAGFIAGRNMHDNIVLAHDIAYDLESGKDDGNVIIKLDMAKAYDRLSWGFLIRVLRRMGFCESWVDLIYRCISNCHYSIKWDGKVFGFFKSNQGVRQGDPLSPALFIIGMDFFSKALNLAIQQEQVMPFYTRRRALTISHLLFADDVLIFTNGSTRSITGLLRVIGDFCTASGQQLNATKSSIVFQSGTRTEHRQSIITLTGFREDQLPYTYLGAPLYRGRTLVEHFHFLEVRVRDRILGWARHFLSMGARLNLVNSVLNAISIHCLLALPVPNTTLDRIARLIRNFVWDSGTEKRRHWVAWDTICTPKNKGGFGIRKPHDIKRVLQEKRAWDFVQGKSLWSRYARSRFTIGKKGSPNWNAITPFIVQSAHNVVWRMGNGATPVNEICFKLGIPAPYYLRRESLFSVAQNVGQLSSLLGTLPSHAQLSFHNIQFSNQPDRIDWKLSKSGTFSAKELYSSFHINIPNPQWASRIWNPWTPPKISVFLWKIFMNVVTTDDNIQRVGIPIVSRCVCCSNPSFEDTEHLLFKGDWGLDIWRYMGNIFDRPRIHSKSALSRVWLRKNKKDFMDCFAAGMAGCAIWEIWKARNGKTFDNKDPTIRLAIRRWAPLVVLNISASYSPSMQNDLILAQWGVRPPENRRIRVWQPSATPSAQPRSSDDITIGSSSRFIITRPRDDLSV